MPSPPILAVFVEDIACQAAVTGAGNTALTFEFANTDTGLDQFLEWARSVVNGETELRWVVTVPSGDGGVVYRWLYEEIPEVFMQNPARLKEYAARTGVAWNTAVALHDFNLAKVW